MIEMKNVAAGYGKNQVLHGVNLRAKQGKITTLIGSNGSGKSTLLHTMLKVIPLMDGDIMVDGMSIKSMAQPELARKIAYLPQGKNVPDISAGRLVLHGRFPYLSYPRKYQKQDFHIAEEAMEKLGISNFKDKQMAELSGGTRQKVYIAMALAQQAPAIVMDEPTTYLDIGQKHETLELIRKIRDLGKTILMVLHDLPLAFACSDRIALLENGSLRAFGPAGEVFDSGLPAEIFGVSSRRVELEGKTEYLFFRE